MSPIEHYSADHTDSMDLEMQSAHVPVLEPLRDDGLPRHVLTIPRDSMNDSATQIPLT